MRRVAVIAVAGLSLGGCGSLSLPGFDGMRSAPAAATLQLESNPPGAEARTSVGPVCKTPCAVTVPADGPFTVTYTLPRYQPQTISIQLVQRPGKPDPQDPDILGPSVVELEPNPAIVQLEPAGPARRAGRPVAATPKKKRAAPAAAAPAEAPVAAPNASPFPPPPPASNSSPFPNPQR